MKHISCPVKRGLLRSLVHTHELVCDLQNRDGRGDDSGSSSSSGLEDESDSGCSSDDGSIISAKEVSGIKQHTANTSTKPAAKNKPQQYPVIPSSRPLAVIDYGSIQFGELDMTGGLLDEIYKLDTGEGRASGSRRGVVGRNNCTSGNNDESASDIVSKKNAVRSLVPPMNNSRRGCVATLKPDQSSANSSLVNINKNNDNGSKSNRTPQVAAVIASLKKSYSQRSIVQSQAVQRSQHQQQQRQQEDRSMVSHLPSGVTVLKRKIGNMQSRVDPKRQRIQCHDIVTTNQSNRLPVVDEFSTTLEDAISFSPFARYGLLCRRCYFCFFIHTST